MGLPARRAAPRQLRAGRRRPRDLKRDPCVALSWANPSKPHKSVAIQGRVVESYSGDEAGPDIARLAKKCLGQDVYPFRQPGGQRLSFLIEPTHVWYLVGG